MTWDMTSTTGISSRANCGAVAKTFGSPIAGPVLGLMAALEASLEGSRSALISLDVAGLAARTREQIGLSHELAAVLHQASGQIEPPSGMPDLSQPFAREQLQIESMRPIAHRIIFAIRLQSALLARLRIKLRVMANLLAGCSAAYGPILSGRWPSGPRP